MMRKTSLVVLSAAAGAAIALMATQPRIGLLGDRAQAAASDTYKQLNLFGDVFERVRSDYVEKPDDGKLVETAVNGMLTALDPHSSYMDAKSFRDMQVQTRGEFGGLGIEVTMEDGVIKVVAPSDGTPAAKAGILANDLSTHREWHIARSLPERPLSGGHRPPPVPRQGRSSSPSGCGVAWFGGDRRARRSRVAEPCVAAAEAACRRIPRRLPVICWVCLNSKPTPPVKMTSRPVVAGALPPDRLELRHETRLRPGRFVGINPLLCHFRLRTC